MLKKIALPSFLILLSYSLIACSVSNLESLADQNRRFSQHLKWNDIKGIQAFFEKKQQTQMSLHINEYFQNNKIIDVSTMTVAKDPKDTQAKVTLNIQWHALDQVNIKQSLWQVEWAYNSSRKNWFIQGLKKL